jgi:hypothetical protein
VKVGFGVIRDVGKARVVVESVGVEWLSYLGERMRSESDSKFLFPTAEGLPIPRLRPGIYKHFL